MSFTTTPISLTFPRTLVTREAALLLVNEIPSNLSETEIQVSARACFLMNEVFATTFTTELISRQATRVTLRGASSAIKTELLKASNTLNSDFYFFNYKTW